MTPILIWKRNNAAKCEYCKEIIKGPGLVDVRVDNHERTCPKNPKAPPKLPRPRRPYQLISKRWTFGHGVAKNLVNWKGKSTEKVLSDFGNPPDQVKPWGQGGEAWTYSRGHAIQDAKRNWHKSVTFFVQNGAVVGVGLPSTQEH